MAVLTTGFQPLTPVGPQTMMDALTPVLRKWYTPQTLHLLYKWKGWEYSNYAKVHYQRYTDIQLEGKSYYDMYGNYVVRGWRIFDWTQEQPSQYGSQLYKSPTYRSWFDNVLVSATSKGQYYTAITVGDRIRTTLTPLTFSKPAFNGAQWDFLSDKYAFTVLASRASIPSEARRDIYDPGADLTHCSNFFGFRGTTQLGDFANVGLTYVNAHRVNSAEDFGMNSFKGVLSGPLNAGNITDITIRLSDDSPEDGVGGATLYAEEIWIDGKYTDVKPFITGGIAHAGVLEANGNVTIELKYDLASLENYKLIKKVAFVLVLANDYRVDVTSNLQTNVTGEEVFLPVARAPGNVKDGSNQRFVRFAYGLPTGNEIYGLTLEVSDFKGFNLRAEYDVNPRYRRFPNQNYQNLSLASDQSSAFYVTVSQTSYPWYAYGEVFSMDRDYSTSFLVGDGRGIVDWSDPEHYAFEFVDDNDDQDEYPDWKRPYQPAYDREVFPGLDENNDLVSDFNQNDNLVPDYEEPFLQYHVDPPEFLFGMDMNNNTVIDRFENDEYSDTPYKKDHRGYNFYGGAEIVPNFKFALGHASQRLLSRDKRAASTYALFTAERSYPRIGELRIFNRTKMVKDDIPDDLIRWVQPPLSKGTMERFNDPLLEQNTWINTSYLEFDLTRFEKVHVVNKLKYETFNQRDSKDSGMESTWFLGAINKIDYALSLGKRFTLQPKWKSMYRRNTVHRGTPLEINELSEIGFLIMRYSVHASTWLEIGTQVTLFHNFIEAPAVPTPDYVGDYTGTVLGIQFSNASDYLGYQLTANAGFRWNREAFEKGDTRITTTAFLRIYAGASG